jgi:bifunctional non-homologous end joining protein LigD
MPSNPFIEPSAPVLRSEPPTGPEWLHEVKHDGWRAQLHLSAGKARLFNNRGADLSGGFRDLCRSIAKLPVRSVIIDAELTPCDDSGMPNFYAVRLGAKSELCAWCFDILEMDGKSLLDCTCAARRTLLRSLIGTERPRLSFSEDFDNPTTLLAAAERLGLEGIVSKRRDQPYVSGPHAGWIKVKTEAWRAANLERSDV